MSALPGVPQQPATRTGVGRVSPLGRCGPEEWDSRLQLSHLQIKRRPLHLGDLSGNRFQVVLRHVDQAGAFGAPTVCCLRPRNDHILVVEYTITNLKLIDPPGTGSFYHPILIGQFLNQDSTYDMHDTRTRGSRGYR